MSHAYLLQHLPRHLVWYLPRYILKSQAGSQATNGQRTHSRILQGTLGISIGCQAARYSRRPFCLPTCCLTKAADTIGHRVLDGWSKEGSRLYSGTLVADSVQQTGPTHDRHDRDTRQTQTHCDCGTERLIGHDPCVPFPSKVTEVVPLLLRCQGAPSLIRRVKRLLLGLLMCRGIIKPLCAIRSD